MNYNEYLDELGKREEWLMEACDAMRQCSESLVSAAFAGERAMFYALADQLTELEKQVFGNAERTTKLVDSIKWVLKGQPS